MEPFEYEGLDVPPSSEDDELIDLEDFDNQADYEPFDDYDDY